jgi:hypothetical protein
MRKAFWLLLLVASCGHLPPLSEAYQNRTATIALCRQAFPPQPWRATHTLFASLPLGYNGALVGVTVADREGLHAMLLSPEGVTLFDATNQVGRDARASRLVIRRAVPPLDRPDFAAGLMADVGNAFLPPPGEPAAIGRSTTGRIVCRWVPSNGDATEVELGATGPARIRTYRGVRPSREIELLGTPDRGFFPEVRLTVPGAGGYTLDMKLVDRE